MGIISHPIEVKIFNIFVKIGYVACFLSIIISIMSRIRWMELSDSVICGELVILCVFFLNLHFSASIMGK